MFLLSLRWQLGEWGFVKREIEIDECYTKMMVGGRVVVTVASEGESITFQWMDAWMPGLGGMTFKNLMSPKT